jgi:hypothetical protein
MKLFRDPLTNPQTGRYSRKSVTAFVSFSLAVVMAISGHFFGYEINMSVFQSFLMLGGGSIMLSSAEKAANHYHERKQGKQQP